MKKRVDKLTKEELWHYTATYVAPDWNFNGVRDDWEAARLIEEAIRLQGRELEYVRVLYSLCAPKYLKKGERDWTTIDIWLCLCATPEQRFRAALKTVVGEWVELPK